MTKRYMARIAASKAAIDADLIAAAKRVGHLGPAALIEAARPIAIDPDYARTLCEVWGGWRAGT